jgi:hypothetical protein
MVDEIRFRSLRIGGACSCYALDSYRGGTVNLKDIKKGIKKEIGKLSRALTVLESIGEKQVKRARKITTAGRKRIAKAQRARWAKIRAAKR